MIDSLRFVGKGMMNVEYLLCSESERCPEPPGLEPKNLVVLEVR
jgi:hypothetical protein